MLDKKMLEYARCAKDPVYFLNNYGYVFDAKKRKVDKMSCFPYQETCIKKFHKEQNNIILKSRQCLPEDTYVDTPNGPKAIKDFKIGDEVYSYNLLSKKVEVDTVYDAWCSGDRQCVKFKLQDTRNFEVGENHPFYVKDKGWVKAKDLQKGDEIIDSNFGFGSINANEDDIKLLVHLITDSSTNKQVKFTNNNINYLGEFEESINNLFPSLNVRKSEKCNGYDYFPYQEHGVSCKNPIMEWCETKEIANKKTEYKLLPEEVFAWNRESVSLLINRLFAGDGWVSILKKGENSKRLELGIASPSEEFLHQIKSLLKKFDIKCNIYEVKNMKLQQNRFFKLRITHSKSVKRFVKNIGIFDKITQEHYDICDNYKHDVKDNPIIKKIEKTVIKKCYDISVSENENFFIDGLLTHNTGLSVVTAGYVAWKLMFRYDEKILIIANDGAGAVRFLDTVKQFIEYLPDWMKPDSIDTENQKKIMFSNNSYAEAKASSPNAGRGDSLTMLILDETAFIKDAEAIWMGAGMALSATGGKCIMISTPNGTGNLYYKTWVDAINQANKFVGTTVHWTENPNSTVNLEWKVNPTGEKVPWSPWYEDQCKRLNWDSVKIAQELDLSFEGSKRLAVDPQLVEKYTKKVNADNKVEGYLRFNYLEKENAALFSEFVSDVTNTFIFKKPEEGKQYIIGCLPPDEKVLTDSGLMNIQDVTIDNKLISESGDYVNIINKQIYQVIDEDVFEMQIDNTFRTTTFTKEHPILISKSILKRNYNKNNKKYKFNERYWDFDFNYTRVEDVEVGDWIKVPNIYKKSIKNIYDDKWKINASVRCDFEFESPLLEDDFWWFMGMWLGDGWLGKNNHSHTISICFDKNHEGYIEKCEDIIKRLFKRSPSFVDKGSTYELVFNSKFLYYFILENFGQYSHGKKISEWVKFISDENKKELIRGYFDSDGCWIKINKNGIQNSKVSFVSINLELLESVQDIIFSLGIISSLTKLRDKKFTIICGRECQQREAYNLTLSNHDSLELISLIYKYDDIKLNKFNINDFSVINKRVISSCHFDENKDYIYFRVKKLNKSKFTGNVYNFECDTHTFMCHHITTHNCDVARGDGQDFSTIQILDVDTLEQVAEFREKISPDLFPYVINYLAKMYNMAYVVIEANSFGLGVCFDMRDKFKYPRNRLYFSKNIKDIHVRHYKYKVNEGTEIPGFQTSRKNRVLLVKAIIEHMREGSLIIHSKRLMAEFQTFVMNGDKPEHEPGFNDDLILALGLALYIRDTEFENVTASTEMYKSMLNAMMLSTSSSAGMPQPINNKKVDIPNGGGGMFIFNGTNNININSVDLDDTSWLLG